MLTVASVFVRGPYPYTAEYVIRLRRMVARHLLRPFTPFRFVCLVDQQTLPEVRAAALTANSTIDTILIPRLDVPDRGAGYWHKVKLFDPALGLSGRVLYLDLDSLIVSSLAPIVDYPATLALTTDALVEERKHQSTDRDGRRLVRRFNSSVMVWDAGAHPEIYADWTPAVAERLSGDQDWIGEHVPGAGGMPLDWFPRLSRVQPPWSPDAKVILCKKPKNHEAVGKWPWFEPLWGAA